MAAPIEETRLNLPKLSQACDLRAYCLVHIYPTGPDLGRRYPLGDRTVLFGRGDDCDVRLTDPSISRRHARIEPTPDGFLVHDLRSTNGTFANDEPIEAPRLLRDGDYLRVGNCLYRFLAGGNVEADYHEEIYRLTIQDGLTRAHNRRALGEFLDREVVRSQRHVRPLSVLMFDLDRFKSVNDSHGHLCGDFVLRELADRVRAGLRKEDMLARYGGEEFAVVLVETDHDGAMEVAERIRRAVSDHPFTFEAMALRVTVSIGVVTTCGDAAATPDSLLRAADERLYEAKRAGRDRVIGENSVTAD